MTRPSQPQPDVLPSLRTLTRASALAVAVAVLLGLGVVLPAETGRDPIGLGSVLGLTEMGRIKVALAAEAEAEAESALQVAAPPTDNARARMGGNTTGSGWRDSIAVVLAPNQGVEVKLAMRRDSTAHFEWAADSSDVYYHMHGEPPDAPKDFAAHSYDKGISFGEQGSIVAVYDGIHGWFWRNRSDKTVTVTLRTRGAYLALQRLP